jgi:hypothetical protein
MAISINQSQTGPIQSQNKIAQPQNQVPQNQEKLATQVNADKYSSGSQAVTDKNSYGDIKKSGSIPQPNNLQSTESAIKNTDAASETSGLTGNPAPKQMENSVLKQSGNKVFETKSTEQSKGVLFDKIV